MPRPLAIDASFALRLILPGPQQEHCQSLLTRWVGEGVELVAPTLWAYEVTSALCKAVRFGEITPEAGRRTLSLALSLAIRLVPPGEAEVRSAFEWTMRLDRAAAYDSFYLSLAEAMQCELWTADGRLYRAAGQPWVHWAGGP